MKEVLRANGRRLARDGRMRLHGPSTIATSAYTAAPALSSILTMAAIMRPLVAKDPIGSKESMEKTAHWEKTPRGLASSSVVKAPCLLPRSGRLQVLGRRLAG